MSYEFTMGQGADGARRYNTFREAQSGEEIRTFLPLPSFTDFHIYPCTRSHTIQRVLPISMALKMIWGEHCCVAESEFC